MAVYTAGVKKGAATSTYQTLDGLLKDFYGPRIAETLNNENFMLKRLEKRKDMKWSGRKVMFPVHTKRNTGVGFRDETGSIPDPGGQFYKQAEITDVLFYGTIQLTGLALDAVLSDRGGFRRALDSEMQGLVNDSKNHFGRAVWGMPVNGTGDNADRLNCVLGTQTGAVVGGKSTILAPLGYANADAASTTRYFRVGQALAWGDPSEAAQFGHNTPVGTGSGYVASVDSATEISVVAETGIAPAGGDQFVIGSNHTNGSFEYDNGLNGLGTLDSSFQGLTSQTFQGIPVTSGGDYTWQTYSKAHGDTTFDTTFLHSLLHNVQELGSGSPTMLASHYSLLLEYVNVADAATRYSNDVIKGGYQTITFASDKVYDWVVDKFCPYGYVFALDETNMFWAVRRDFGWDDRGGAVLKSLAAGSGAQDGVKAFYKSYLQLAFNNLNSHGIARGIKVDSADLPR